MITIHTFKLEESPPIPNSPLPVVVYKGLLQYEKPQEIEELFKSNGWKNTWINGIYSYHHYHSNTHEALGIFSGYCQVLLGGDEGEKLQLQKGDLLLIPAGVSHKNCESSEDFVCVGAYPFSIDYDMNYCKEEEFPLSKFKISHVPLPKTDPIYGVNGVLFEYWK